MKCACSRWHPERIALHGADPTIDDEALLAAFVAGDDSAYAQLVTRYERRVFGICLRYFGNATDAEDAAQDAMLTLYRKASTFKGTSKFSTWMYRVTTNACNDVARRRARRPKKADADIDVMPLADPGDDIGSSELRLDLRQALLQLDPPHRRAVIAHTVNGIPYADIAESEGVAVGTIKSRVHRGHAKLAAVMSEADSAAGDPVVTLPPPAPGSAAGVSDRGRMQRLERGPPPT